MRTLKQEKKPETKTQTYRVDKTKTEQTLHHHAYHIYHILSTFLQGPDQIRSDVFKKKNQLT